MNKLRLWLASFSFIAILLVPTLVSADVNDFIITAFKADETLTRNDPQGELHIIEHINVDFNAEKHGILRAIPGKYKNHSLQLKVNSVSSESGAPVQFSTSDSYDNVVLKIGDPDRLITGPQEYTIDYTLKNVITFYNDHDELFWDVNGTEWSQTFNSVKVDLNLPEGVKFSRTPVCYAGVFESNQKNCTILTSGNTLVSATSQPLISRQTLTYAAGFQKGYFSGFHWYDPVLEHLTAVIKFLIPLLLLGGGSIVYWLKKGRDAKGTGIIIPQYSPPEGLKPLAVGTIADFGADNRDITATIIDLAIRRYLKIHEIKQTKVLQKDSMTYNLELIYGNTSKLDSHESALLEALFPDLILGTTVDISSMKNKLYKTSEKIRKNVENELTAAGYFRSNPLHSGSTLTTIAILTIMALYGAGQFLGAPVAEGLVIGALIALAVGKFMAARTAKGVQAKEHILGMKMYMETAEKDRLAKLQAPNAPYAANAAEPVKTVELFEKLLPYAMVLGVEKQWSKQFESLYTAPPDWYSGNWTTFNSYYLASSLTGGMNTAVNTAFSSPSSSGSSGFGGGGFSGGGGGGGGGGGW